MNIKAKMWFNNYLKKTNKQININKKKKVLANK